MTNFKLLLSLPLVLLLNSCVVRKAPRYQPLYEIIPVSVGDTIIGGVRVTGHREYVIVPANSVNNKQNFRYVKSRKIERDTTIIYRIDTVVVGDTIVRYFPILVLHFRPYITKLTLEQEAQLRDFLSLLDSMNVVKVEAYTDSLPPNDTTLNLQLSKERAYEVVRYLKTLRPDISFQVKVFGPQNYLEPNTTESGRMRNRRVFLIAIGTKGIKKHKGGSKYGEH